jgi:hypothetical protein
MLAVPKYGCASRPELSPARYGFSTPRCLGGVLFLVFSFWFGFESFSLIA